MFSFFTLFSIWNWKGLNESDLSSNVFADPDYIKTFSLLLKTNVKRWRTAGRKKITSTNDIFSIWSKVNWSIPMPKKNERIPRVLSIQSHVVHGFVGNRCAAFILQVLFSKKVFVFSRMISFSFVVLKLMLSILFTFRITQVHRTSFWIRFFLLKTRIFN